MSKANRKSAIPAGTSANTAGKSKAASPVTVAKPAAKKALPVPAKAKSARRPAANSAVKAPMAMKSKIAKVAAVAAPKAKKTKPRPDPIQRPDARGPRSRNRPLAEFVRFRDPGARAASYHNPERKLGDHFHSSLYEGRSRRRRRYSGL